MKITEEAILNKTHYGLNIYSYILRQCYPGETVLSLSGKDCKLTKNPFNENKETLSIKIVDGCAIHTDTEEILNQGNAFDFAGLFFNLEGQALLDKLNEVLHLRIHKVPELFDEFDLQPEVALPEPNKPSSPIFSYFSKPVSNVVPQREISLVEVYQLIKGNDFASCTSTLRNIQDGKEARKYKAFNFDYVTFSGVFSRRNDKNLKRHTGLLTIDFDHIDDISGLKERLLNDEYFETELLFTSPSGDGLKWIIPIELTKVKHQEYFKAVANYIQFTYSLEVDGSGKDISRACFLPHDPNVYINPKYL